MRIGIITALRAEARPLIEYFGPKQDTQARGIPIYKGKGICLAISGVGKVRSAIATASLLSQRQKTETDLVICNFGLCGSLEPEYELGSLNLVHKITDAGTGRDFYPDILFNHGLNEMALTTFDLPVQRNPSNSSSTGDVKSFEGGVDMEAAGFFSAASTFLSPERIVCCKLVSDRLEGGELDQRLIERWIRDRLSTLESVIQAATQCVGCSEPVLGEADRVLLSNLREALRLTSTQGHQLKDWACAYILRHGGPISFLNIYLKGTVRHKSERDRLLAKIRDELLAE